MTRPREQKTYALVFLAAMLLAACAGEREPAQRMMNAIDATINAAAADASKYAPDRLNDVQTQFDDLKTAFTAQDFKGVLARGPSILTEAQGLASAAAARKAEAVKDLNEEWAHVSGVVPADFTAIQSRIEMLSSRKNRQLAKGIDLDAAKSALSEATSLWSKAQGAFGNGNMDEAVSTAKDVKAKLETEAGTLKLDLPKT